MFQRDYLLRIIEQIAQAVAGALGLMRKQQPQEAELQLDNGYGALGIDRELLCMLDGPSLAKHFGHPEKLVAAARLLLCDAQLQHQRSDSRAAQKFLRAARKLAAQLEAPNDELVTEIAATAALISA